MMKKTVVIAIIICLALIPFVFGTSTPHNVGTELGKESAKSFECVPTDTYTPTAKAQSDVPVKTDTEKSLTDCPVVVFIVSTDKATQNAMNTTAIVCYTMPIGNGQYMWRGVNSGWAGFEHIYYSITVIGNKNDFTFINAAEYMLGEKTERAVYVKQTVGLSNF